jgi:hypothetical protein
MMLGEMWITRNQSIRYLYFDGGPGDPLVETEAGTQNIMNLSMP